MKRLLKYLIVLLIALVCVYLFWIWLQYKGTMVINQTTTSIVTELQALGKLETVKKTFTITIEGEQQLVNLMPNIGTDEIITSALFKNDMALEVQGEVSAGYMIKDIDTGDIKVSDDGTVRILLGEPQIFGVLLTGITQSTKLGIVTPKDIAMEKTLRENAGALLLQDALSGNILQEAKNNAQSALQNVFLKANIQIKEVILLGTGDLK